MSDISQEALIGLMEALKDPIKKAKILEGLLAHNKVKHQSPLNKVRKVHCESPTSLLRRRALQEVKDNASSDSSSSTSDPSESSAEILGPKLPFDKILKGIVAFVEVKMGGKEQSEGIKMIVQSMGATVRDKFTRDVTHVIFKDGCFKTYEKAKLLKCHLVSVLWVDAVRRNSARVAEAKYRPFGPQSDNPDISILCSKLQKDYEAIVKDEKRRSFSLPRVSKVHDKRKTVHAPSTSSSSFRKSVKPQHLPDTRKRTPSPGLTSDDSDCGIVNGHSFNYLKNVYPSTPSITDDSSAAKSSHMNNILNNSSGSYRTANISDKSSSKAETSSLLIADSSAEKQVSNPMDIYDMVQPASQVISANSSNDSFALITRRKSRSRKTINKDIDMDLTSNVVDHNFNVNRSSGRKILKEATVILTPNISTDSDRTPSDIFRKSLEKSGTTMSSLRVSSDSNLCKINGSNKENTVQSTMSSLRLSKDLHTPDKPLVSKSLSCLLGNSSVSAASPRRNVTTRKKPATSKKNLRENVDSDLPLSLNFEESVKTPGSNRKIIPSDMKTLINTPRAVSSKNSSSNSTNIDESLEKNSQRSVSRCSTSTCSTDQSKSCEKTRAKKVREIGLSDSDSETSPSPLKIQKKNETPVKTTFRRKLYDPDNAPALDLPDEEQEREKRFNKNKTPVADFVDPNKVSVLNIKKRGKSLDKNGIVSGPSSSKNVPKSARKSRRQLDMSESETEPNSSNKVPKIQRKKVQSTLPSQNAESGSVYKLSNAESEDEEVQSLTASSLRRSQRLSVSERPPKYNYSSASSASTEDIPIKRIARRSTLDFQSMSLSQKQRMFKSDQVSSIVCTKFHRDECEKFQGIVKKLGRFYYENNVTDQTTHVVAGECKRTLNILRGIARGCWILKHEWLLESEQEGRWLPEEDYELTEFSKAVQKCRLERQAFGPSFSMDIFANCGNIYVGPHTNPPAKDLKQLIILCKGTVTMQQHNAKISVGQIVAGDDIACVSELWVLDSITFNKLEKTSKFLLQPLREDSPEF